MCPAIPTTSMSPRTTTEENISQTTTRIETTPRSTTIETTREPTTETAPTSASATASVEITSVPTGGLREEAENQIAELNEILNEVDTNSTLAFHPITILIIRIIIIYKTLSGRHQLHPRCPPGGAPGHPGRSLWLSWQPGGRQRQKRPQLLPA